MHSLCPQVTRLPVALGTGGTDVSDSILLARYHGHGAIDRVSGLRLHRNHKANGYSEHERSNNGVTAIDTYSATISATASGRHNRHAAYATHDRATTTRHNRAATIGRSGQLLPPHQWRELLSTR